MDEEIKNIVDKVKSLKELVYDYIINTEHFIFYWFPNEKIRKFIENNPDDYDDMICISVADVGEVSAKVRIQLGSDEETLDDEDNVLYLYFPMQNFRETVNREWKKYNGELMELRIEEAKRNLEYHKKKVADLTAFIDKHENK